MKELGVDDFMPSVDVGKLIGVEKIVGGFAVNIGEPSVWETKYFLIPFFSYAGGTIVGALIIAKYSVSHHLVLSIFVGLLFLLRDFSTLSTMPYWFAFVQISLAYIPMGWFGWKLTGQNK